MLSMGESSQEQILMSLPVFNPLWAMAWKPPSVRISFAKMIPSGMEGASRSARVASSAEASENSFSGEIVTRAPRS